MGNMSYCRLENTYRDLQDCKEALDRNDLPTNEYDWKYLKPLIELCRGIVEEHGDREFGEFKEQEER
jgi:hypothetical protein